MSDIRNVAVIGAGVLGSQIAFQVANRGFTVTSWDVNDDAIAAAKEKFDSYGPRYINDVDGATEESVAEARERITQTTDLEEAVRDADVVLEAVSEKIEIKKDVWEKIGRAAPESAVFLTNSSTLLPSDIAPFSGSPERFLSFHFANNIWVLNIVEVMAHAGTRDGLVDEMAKFGEDIGMEPVVIRKEKAGYVLNSLLIPFLYAAQELWIGGYASIEDIDKDWRVSTGSPTGPFEFMDMIGLNTVYAIASTDAEAPDAPEWLKEMTRTLKEDYLDKGRTSFYDK